MPAVAPPSADPRRTFLDRLLAVHRGLHSALTPTAIGTIFGGSVHATESAHSFRVGESGEAVRVAMQASSTESPVTWIEFYELQSLGVTLSDLEGIYGTELRALPPAKLGTTVIFTPKPGALPANTYVSALLWSSKADPTARVSYLQLRAPR